MLGAMQRLAPSPLSSSHPYFRELTSDHGYMYSGSTICKHDQEIQVMCQQTQFFVLIIYISRCLRRHAPVPGELTFPTSGLQVLGLVLNFAHINTFTPHHGNQFAHLRFRSIGLCRSCPEKEPEKTGNKMCSFLLLC